MALILRTLEEHLSQFSPEILDTICTEEHLVMLCTSIADWRDLSPYLRLTPSEEYAIAATFPPSSHSRQCIDALRKWRESRGITATYRYIL